VLVNGWLLEGASYLLWRIGICKLGALCVGSQGDRTADQSLESVVGHDDLEVRQAVVDAGHVLAVAGQGDLIWGHVAVRDPGGRGVWMKGAGWGLDEAEPEHVVLVGNDGDLLLGTGRRHVEYSIHTQVMLARPDVGCVVHTHAEHSTAFAALGRPLRPVSHEGALFVPPDLARFTATSGLIRNPQLGKELARTLGARNAVLLAGHGVVTVGPDVPTAVMSAILLDRACRLQLQLEAAGGARFWTSDADAVAKRAECWPAEQLQAAWGYLLRRVVRDREACHDRVR
jgi:ribulose-5-phosphate 4-epimerase/fuculose-1-phosphate aldolase